MWKINFFPNFLKRSNPEPELVQILQLNREGRELIKLSEGLKLKAYLCSGGVWTIGYGSTRWFDGRLIKHGDEITFDDANKLFERDVKVFSANVRNLCKVDLTTNQFSALVSLSYNIGIGNFRASTLLRKLNRGDTVGASGEFWKWRRAKGVILPGLVARRKKECRMFTS